MTDFQKEAQEAVMHALRNGGWKDIPWLASAVQVHGLDALLREITDSDKTTTAGDAEKPTGEADVVPEEEGPGWPDWATWRVQLPGTTPSVVYFSRKPHGAELRAFAGAAGVPLENCRAEERM